MSDTYTADTAAPDDAAPAPVAADDASTKTYKSESAGGVREALADRQRDLDEKAKANPPPSADRLAKAKQKLADHVAEKMGAESVDLDMITWNDKDDKNLAARKVSKALAEFRRQKEAGLQEILRQEDAAAEVEQATAKADEDWAAQLEAAAQQERAAEEHQRQQQVRQQTHHLTALEHELQARQQQYQNMLAVEAPEIIRIAQLSQSDPAQGQQAWAEFVQRDPQAAQKFARYQQLDAAYRNDQLQAALITSQHQQHQQQVFQEYGRAEDEKFKAAHPEIFADRRAQFETQQDVVAYLTEKRGLSEDRLRQLWNTDPMFRSAEAQGIILDAARQYSMEKRRNEIRPNMPPQPQRPGVSTGRLGMNGSGETLQKIDTAGSQRKQLTAAAEVVMARRRAAARSR